MSAARAALADLRDPEIPTAGIIELGMLHDIREEDGELVVELLPTFSGCPAIAVIVENVEAALREAGVGSTRVVTRFDLPWSTDMISPTGRRQVADFGIVPPQPRQLAVEDVVCLNCHQRNVALVSRFGPTPCRATARCRSCGEPLEIFKPVGVDVRP
jgi:ring-1,2-phenylacetyl-CoA epoxidase subunit PaaD